MGEHPIEGLMQTTMESIKEMVDVNTIVGDPVESPDGLVIIPISKVSFGFAAGGSEFNNFKKNYKDKDDDKDNSSSKYPFGGGSGAGVSVQPVAFIVVGNEQIKLLPVDQGSNLINNIIEAIPKFTGNLQNMIKSKNQKKEHKGKDNIEERDEE